LTRIDWIEVENGVYTLRKKPSRPIIKIEEDIDNHERCRTCIKYPAECMPPPDIDTSDCHSYTGKNVPYNPSRRKP